MIAATLTLAALSAAAPAARPATWTHNTEAEFAAGTLEGIVLTSLGEVMLGRKLETLVEPDEKLGMVSAVAAGGDDRLYVATFPQAELHVLANGKLKKLADLPGVLIRSLHVRKDGSLLLGLCGDGAGVYRVSGDGEVKKLWSDEAVDAVWEIVPIAGADECFAATGPEGKVFRVDLEKGEADVIYDGEDKNILSLAARDKGGLYAGTGENGLIVEIDPATKTGRILYDAPEKEISRLVIDGSVLYAATSDSTKASADGGAPSQHVTGKPAEQPEAENEDQPAPDEDGDDGDPPEDGGGDEPEDDEGDGDAGGEGEAPEAQPEADADADPAPRPAARPVATRPAGLPKGARVIVGPPGPDGKRKVMVIRKKAKPAAKPAANGGRRVVVARRSSKGKSAPKATPSGNGKGNAVYRIAADGTVRDVFRRPVTILDMALDGDTLLLATGKGGQVFAIDQSADRTMTLAKVDPKSVTALARAGEKLYFGTADSGGLFRLGPGRTAEGTLVSKVLDAKQISQWGAVRLMGRIPDGAAATLAVRSGNVAEAEDETWSSWSAELPAGEGWSKLDAPPGRYLQYRLTLSGKGEATPVLEQVELVYQARNLPPVVQAVQVMLNASPKPGEKRPGPKRYAIVGVKAGDPNGDKLVYDIYFRRRGNQRWIRLAEEHDKPVYAWDTAGVADGRYEFYVSASDAEANAPRLAETDGRASRAFIIDNTRPTVANLAAQPGARDDGGAAPGRNVRRFLTITGTATDATSRIVSIEYSIDSNDDWTEIAPDDGICDSLEEPFTAEATEVEPGVHRVAVKVTDANGNVGYSAVEVEIPNE
jgi:hypothetical protein